MDERPFKFRYANQMAGSFVILALALAVFGIIAAGRAKGWFEGKFELRATFDTVEGTFGLKEGNEVLVRSTVAGRVGKIVPNQEGQMETSFLIQERFRQFVTVDSVARVKKKFGVAGDAFVEIQAGTGEPVQDGAMITCKQDEEVMGQAQRVLAQVQEVIVPLMNEIKDILHHVNEITGELQEGKGLAGTVLKDEQMVTQVKTSVERVNGILLDTQSIVKDLQGTVAEVSELATDPALIGGVRGAIENANGLMVDSQLAVQETTKLLRGLQQHWLLRKYVQRAEKRTPLSEAYIGAGDLSQDAHRWESTLKAARLANDSGTIALAACHLASVMLGEGRVDDAGGLVEEAREESARGGVGGVEVALIEAEWRRARGETGAALQSVSAVLPRVSDDDLRVYAYVLMSDLYMDEERTDEARDAMGAGSRRVGKDSGPITRAMLAGAQGRLALLEKQAAIAAAFFDQEAAQLSAGGAYVAMASSLVRAGDAWALGGDQSMAADRYYRAARSLDAADRLEPAADVLTDALESAQKGNNPYVLRHAGRLKTRIDKALEDRDTHRSES